MRVKQAEYIDGYKIKILFLDGVLKVVDFVPFLKTAKHVFIPLRDVEYFKEFILDEITLSWPNDADFDPELLYEMGKEPVAQLKNPPSKKISKRQKKITSPTHS